MSKAQEIYEGWKNLSFPNYRIEKEAKRRIATCIDCSKLTKRNFCELCGCYMPAKVRSPKSRCRLGKW